MNILITGASGFVGRHLVKRLTSEKHTVITCNSINFADVLLYNTSAKFDVIIHLAVKTAAGGYCQLHSGEQYLINTDINNTIMNFWYRYQKNAKFITFGSSCGYSDGVIKSEDNYLYGIPESGYEVYGNIKRSLLVGLKALNSEFGMNYTYLIPSTFYGESYDANDKHFIFDLIRKIVNAKNGGDKVVLWGDGSQMRELIYINDAVDIIVKSMYWEHKIVNLSTGVDTSMCDYAKEICNIVDYDFNLIKWDLNAFVGAKSKNLINTYLTDYKFTPLSDGLKKTVEYYENNICSC